MRRLYWLLLLWFSMLVCARVADAQKTFYGADSAEKVRSALVTAIPSSQTISAGSPFLVTITTGDGTKFGKIPKPFIVTCAPQAENASTAIEEFLCSAVSGNILTLTKRSLSNTTAQTWATGSYFGYRISALQLKQIQDTLNWLITSGPGTGTITSLTFQSPLTGGTITSSGTVTLPMATSGQNGYLSSANWSTFNNKQSTISVTSPVTLSGATIGIVQSDATHAGYISSTDWNTFNNKTTLADTTGNTTKVLTVLASGSVGWSSAGSGTVASLNVSGGTSGLTFSGGPITSSGTISITSGMLALGFGGTNASTAAQARVNILPDTTSKTGKYLRVLAGGGIVWDTASGSGSSGVTSVAASVPAFLSIAGSPITTTGTLAFTLSGTALPYSSGGTGQTAWTKGDVLYASATNTLSKLAIGSTGQILTVASGLPSWAANGAGTVTSVAASGPSGIMTWSSAVTTSGTLTATLSSQTANTFLGAPDGSDGTPSFRALVTGDIPSLDVAKITSGSFSVARGGTGRSTLTANDLIIGNGTSAVTLLAAGGANTVLSGSTTPSYVTLATGTTLVGNGIGTGFDIDLTHANSWTAAITEQKDDIKTTYTTGLALTNTTASDATNTVQQSPSDIKTAHVWNTTTTAMDSTISVRTTLVPTTGTTTGGALRYDFGNTGAGFTNVASLSNLGIFNVLTGGAYDINGTSVLNATTLGSGVVNSSLTSVGTIATGVWNGTTVAANHGGTGATTLTGVLFGNGTSAITGSHAVALTSEVTGTLPVANGGTSLATLTAHSLYVGNGTSAPTALGAATNGQIAIGSTGADPVLAALTGTAAQVTVTNSAGGITLSLPNTITLLNSAVGILQIAATASTDGKQMSIVSGASGSGTNLSGGPLLLKVGSATGTGTGEIDFSWPSIGTTGTTVVNGQIQAKFFSATNSGTSNYAVFGIGGSGGVLSRPGQIRLYNDSGGYCSILPDDATNGTVTATLRHASNADFLLETSNLSGTGSLIVNTTTRGVLSQVAIGSTGQVLTVSGGVPTWAATSTATGVRGGLVHGSTTGLTAGLTYYVFPCGNSTAGVSIAIGNEYPESSSFTLQHLHVKSNAAAGAGQNTTVTIYVNGAPASVIATISGGASTTASDDVNTFSVSADDLVTIQLAPSATSAATGITWSFEEVAR